MMRSKSVSICNRSRARLVDSSRNRTFSTGYPNLMHSYGGLLEPRGQALHRWNLRLMPNISYADCPGLIEWFRCNSLLKCVSQPKIAKNSRKRLFWGFKVVQGHRCRYHRKARQQWLLWCAASLCLSAAVLTLDEPVVVKLRFLGGTPLWCLRSSGVSSPMRLQIISLETRDPRLPYGEHPESLSHRGLIRYRVVTPGQTDRQTDGQTEFS